MITIIPTPEGFTWRVTHIEIPLAISYKKYKGIQDLLAKQDKDIPTYMEVDGQSYDPSMLIPLTATHIYIIYEGVPYVTQIAHTD